MKWKERLIVGGLLGLALVGAWLIVGGPRTTGPTQTAAGPTGVPVEIARLIERLAPDAREAYAFALERPDVLSQMPCYCGCGSIGHTSNLSCFVRPTAAGGAPALDSHGAT